MLALRASDYTAGAGGVVSTAEYLDPICLDSYIAAAQLAQAAVTKFAVDTGASPQLWMGETSGAGGATHGANLVIGRFLGIFWFADKLGAAAATGHSVVCKQQYQYQAFSSSDSGAVEVTPEYWLSLLWKRLVGHGVLKVRGGGGLVRVYAGKDLESGAVTAIIINLSDNATTVSLNIPSTEHPRHELYSLSAWPDATNMQANATALNGHELKLNSDGTAPALSPAVAVGSLVAVPSLSVSFAVFSPS